MPELTKKLVTKDYIDILNFYNQSIPKSKRLIQLNAEKIMAQKLCKCIKKLDPNINEPRAIGICTKSIFGEKGFKRGKFTCKAKQSVKFLKRPSYSAKLTRRRKK